MGYDPRVHHRRSIRLQGYDYSEEGAYFVTICAQDRALRFGEVRGEQMWPNDAGRMVQAAWDGVPHHYPGVDIDVFQLMPNHLHGIIVLYADEGEASSGSHSPVADATDRLSGAERGPCALSLPGVVQRLKSLTTTRYREGVARCGWPRFRRRLWQRNYHEHVVRDEDELDRIRQYIIDNPANWEYDRENPRGKQRDEGEPWLV